MSLYDEDGNKLGIMGIAYRYVRIIMVRRTRIFTFSNRLET